MEKYPLKFGLLDFYPLSLHCYYECNTKLIKMNIPKNLMEKWDSLQSNGDVEKIAASAGLAKATIYKALSTGKASDEVFEAIANYYQEKDERISSYLSDITN